MTPQPQHHARRVVARRSAVLLTAVLAVGGTPLVARALGDDVAPQAAQVIEVDTATPSVRQSESRIADRAVRSAPSIPRARREAAPAPVVDPVIAVLADTYTWDERGLRVVVLQQALGIVDDGRYGSATQQAHRVALDFVGLPTGTVPSPMLPPGPDPSKWAALRECESNGNYAITNPSGKYRGAYQFDRSTWNSVAERHAPRLVGVDPAAAAPADQDAMALALYNERGSRPWPHCGRHLA